MEWLIQGQKTISPSQKFYAKDPVFHISKEPRNEHCHASITDCKARGSAATSPVSVYSLFLTTLWRFALAVCVYLWIFYSVLWFTLTVFVSIPDCLCRYGSAVQFEVTYCDVSGINSFCLGLLWLCGVICASIRILGLLFLILWQVSLKCWQWLCRVYRLFLVIWQCS